MNRKIFFKSILGIIAAPSILSKIKWTKPKVNSTIISDLQMIKPNYYSDYVAKYGNKEFTWWLTEMGKYPIDGSIEFFYFENKEKKIVSDLVAGEPVTITIKKEDHGKS